MDAPLNEVLLTVSVTLFGGQNSLRILLGGKYFETHNTKVSDLELISKIRTSLRLDPAWTPPGPPEIKESMQSFVKKGSFQLPGAEELNFDPTDRTVSIYTWAFDFNASPHPKKNREEKIIVAAEKITRTIVRAVEDAAQISTDTVVRVIVVPGNGLEYLLHKHQDLPSKITAKKPKIKAKTLLPESTAKIPPLNIVAKIHKTSARVIDYTVEWPNFTKESSMAFAQELSKILDARFLVGDILIYPDEFLIDLQTVNSRRDNHHILQTIKKAVELALGQKDLVFEVQMDRDMKFKKVEKREE
ncbi:hypothetical protein DL98DRAFT_660011 [Cadophora sp. DSE1049]|nr:hypothetical protein DL98DRAFT_660011 [Cadophora sp. DSE1049]